MHRDTYSITKEITIVEKLNEHGFLRTPVSLLKRTASYVSPPARLTGPEAHSSKLGDGQEKKCYTVNHLRETRRYAHKSLNQIVQLIDL
jgi:hypothetical protein